MSMHHSLQGAFRICREKKFACSRQYNCTRPLIVFLHSNRTTVDKISPHAQEKWTHFKTAQKELASNKKMKKVKIVRWSDISFVKNVHAKYSLFWKYQLYWLYLSKTFSGRTNDFSKDVNWITVSSAGRYDAVYLITSFCIYVWSGRYCA